MKKIEGNQVGLQGLISLMIQMIATIQVIPEVSCNLLK